MSVEMSTTSSNQPTASYRIATTSGSGSRSGSVSASGSASTLSPGSAAKPGATRSASVAGPVPEGLQVPSGQRSARLSLPPRLEPSSQTSPIRRPSLQPPLPPPSPELRRRAALVFYAVVLQFFFSIGCLLCVMATAIVLFTFDLYCLFGSVSLTGSLAAVTFVCVVIAAQLIASSLGLAAFNGKKQVEVKVHLLIIYLTVNLLLILLNAGLIFFCTSGAILSFMPDAQCAGESKYYELIVLSSILLFFGILALLHLIDTAGVSVLLCHTDALFIQKGSSGTAAPPATPTIKEPGSTVPAPPIKRFSQV